MVESIFVRGIYEEVHTIFADGFQAPDLLSLLAVTMKIIQHKPEMRGRGSIKKEVAILVFEMVLKESGFFNAEQSKEASRFLVNSLPTLVDTLKSLGKSIQKKSKKWCC